MQEMEHMNQCNGETRVRYGEKNNDKVGARLSNKNPRQARYEMTQNQLYS